MLRAVITSAFRFRQKSQGRRVLEGSCTGLLLALLIVGAEGAGWFERLEGTLYDLRVLTFAGSTEVSSEVVLVDIRESSLDWVKENTDAQWPWPREAHALLIDFLNRSGAKCIVYDILFLEHSRFGVSDDEALVKAMGFGVPFVGIVDLSRELGVASWGEHPALPYALTAGSVLPLTVDYAYGQFQIEEVSQGATSLGHATATIDGDSTVRRMELLSSFDGRAVASLALAAYLTGEGIDEMTLEDQRLRVGESSFVVNDEMEAIIRYRGPAGTHPHFLAEELIGSELRVREGEEPYLDGGVFAGKYVLVGTSATSLRDLKSTPVGKIYPGVEVHATVLDNLLQNDFLRETSRGFNGAYVLLVGLLAGAASRFTRRAGDAWFTVLLGIVLPLLLAWLAYPLGWWLPGFAPFLAAALPLTIGLIINYTAEDQQKQFIKGAFGQYLSPVVIERLMENPQQLKLGGEKRCLSIFFSDVEGFTQISESLDPERLTALLNRYLSAVTGVIYEYSGTVDKYDGDAVIAFWNAPVDVAHHAAQAVRAGIAYQRLLGQMSAELREMSSGEVRARIGINTGDVVIGNMGSTHRFNYTFFGDAGNLASRLEGLNKEFGTYFIVSEFTKAEAGAVEGVYWRELSRVQVVGKSQAVTVYEPMEAKQYQEGQAVYDRFAEGLRCFYEGDFEEALVAMEGIADVDPPARRYGVKIRGLLATRPERWQGVWVSASK